MPLIYLSPYYSANDYSLPIQGISAFRYYDNYGGVATNYSSLVYFTTPMDLVQASAVVNEVWSGSIDGDAATAAFTGFLNVVLTSAADGSNLSFGTVSALETADHLYTALQPYVVTSQASDTYLISSSSFADNITVYATEAFLHNQTLGDGFGYNLYDYGYSINSVMYEPSLEEIWFSTTDVTVQGLGFDLLEFPVPQDTGNTTRYISDLMDFSGSQYYGLQAGDEYDLPITATCGNITIHDSYDETLLFAAIASAPTATISPSVQNFTMV